MKVLIAGAGLGGLCLAHALRRAGVEVQVLERRPGPADQPASYGIHLNGHGLAALHACIPEANWEQLVAAAVPAPDVVRFHDEHLRTLAVLDNEPLDIPADAITRRRAVSRGALRDALLLGLNTETRTADDVIRWNRAVTGYRHTPDGRIAVQCFDDGTEEACDLLVAADGANSRIRGQRLPGLSRRELGILNIAGRAPLTPDLVRELPATLIDGAVNNIVPRHPGWMFVSTWHLDTADTDSAPRPRSAAVWAWVGDQADYPRDVGTWTPAQLHDHVKDRTADWSPAIRRLLDHTDTTTVAPVPLRTMPILEPWEPSRVTLLGDAIHNMTPMAGIGANTALRDAAELADALLTPGTADLTTRIGTYEQNMREYANQALALSTRNARNAASPKRLPRTAFRSLLRIAEAAPPVKRKIFNSRPADRSTDRP
jgi:2-polyprenyl-6-methoxyphenol hydroxylase-like FAD-dependent oxidoreductase